MRHYDGWEIAEAVDKDAEKVNRLSEGHCTIYEPGLEDLLRANLASERLRFTTNLPEAVAASRVVFVAVGTPGRPDGSAGNRSATMPPWPACPSTRRPKTPRAAF